MLRIVLATSNNGKLNEFQGVLSELPVRLIPQSELRILSVEETATTFVENAIIKARHATAFSGLPAIADDSGLIVNALNGDPGVRSARYASKDADKHANINKLLSTLENIDNNNRAASLYCVVVLMKNKLDPTPLICEGIWGGEILRKPVGENGFGYDSVFYVPELNLSAAQLSVEEKNNISHRGQALAQLAKELEGLLLAKLLS